MNVYLRVGSISADGTNYKKYLTTFGANAFIVFDVPDSEVELLSIQEGEKEGFPWYGDPEYAFTLKGMEIVLTQWMDIVNKIENNRRKEQ